MLTPSNRGEVDLPVAEGDLGETFGPDLLEEASRPARGRPRTDAETLFEDCGPRRRETAADARSRARRCPDCTSVVPAGMALCPTCGLNLETGQREEVEHLADHEPAVQHAPAPPLGITLIGSLVLLISLVLGVLSFSKLEPPGGLLLAIVCVFSAGAAIQFLRGKTARLLIAALLVGAGIDVVGLVFMPVYQAQTNVTVVDTPANPDAEEDTGQIKSLDQRLDVSRIYWGIGILLADGVVIVYLCTGGVRRHFERQRFVPTAPIV